MKTSAMNFRLEPNERALVILICKRESMKPSEALRKIIREAAERRGLPPAGLVELAGLLPERQQETNP